MGCEAAKRQTAIEGPCIALKYAANRGHLRGDRGRYMFQTLNVILQKRGQKEPEVIGKLRNVIPLTFPEDVANEL